MQISPVKNHRAGSTKVEERGTEKSANHWNLQNHAKVERIYSQGLSWGLVPGERHYFHITSPESFSTITRFHGLLLLHAWTHIGHADPGSLWTTKQVTDYRMRGEEPGQSHEINPSRLILMPPVSKPGIFPPFSFCFYPTLCLLFLIPPYETLLLVLTCSSPDSGPWMVEPCISLTSYSA